MPRRKIEFTKGGYYHLTNRTSSGELLFREMEDFFIFDMRASAYAEDSNIKIIAQCLMPTHYHLLIRQDGDITATKFIHRLSVSYSKIYKKRHAHHGSLFGSRFSATEINSVIQMYNTCCYLHANSFEAGLVDNPLDWPAGDLSLFYSEEFWAKGTDPALLECFGSLAGFKAAFENYLQIIKVKQRTKKPGLNPVSLFFVKNIKNRLKIVQKYDIIDSMDVCCF